MRLIGWIPEITVSIFIFTSTFHTRGNWSRGRAVVAGSSSDAITVGFQ